MRAVGYDCIKGDRFRMEIIKSIIERLQATSSRNEKIAILEESKGNELWTEILKFLFDPMVVTGMSSKKIAKFGVIRQEQNIGLLGVMNHLRTHNTGRDEDVALVVAYACAFPEHKEWLLQLFTKSLKLGIDTSTINKVYGKNFIKVFSVMLAESFKDNPTYLDGKDFIITQKLDGCRCVAFVHENGEVQFFTRNGQDYGEVPDVAADLLSLGVRGVAYDGELIADSNLDDTGAVFRQTISTANSKGVKTGLIYHVFDVLPIEEFLDGYSPENCRSRKYALSKSISRAEVRWVENVEILYEGNDQSKINEWMAVADSNGWEGLMLNVADAPYRSKRVRDLLKVKKFKTVDVRVTGTFEGEGALVGLLGGIIAEFDVDGKTYEVKCGSGFNLEQRKKYWKDYQPKLLYRKGDRITNDVGEPLRFAEDDIYEEIAFVDLVGKIVELKCFEISKDADGKCSLRFPIWLDIIRFDKDTTSVV